MHCQSLIVYTVGRKHAFSKEFGLRHNTAKAIKLPHSMAMIYNTGSMGRLAEHNNMVTSVTCKMNSNSTVATTHLLATKLYSPIILLL